MKFYITTPIYYINAVPHIGHAYTTVIADAVARWHRLRGDDVFFLTGLDENSEKTVEAAREQAYADVRAYADFMAETWKKAWRALEISNDDFIRTTEERHRSNVHELLERVRKAGDIYKGVYEGLYCDGCEAYLTESDLVDGKCPLHGKAPRAVNEENYFFRLSKYADRILEHIEKNPDFIMPEGRRNEVMSFLKSGLKDVSISRRGAKWGIDFPGDPSHRVWVWFDALCNYLAPKGRWPADVHIIAKDILRFHCVIWPGMLLSAGLDLPRRIFAHGFITIEGKKISKSLGNVVDPVHLAEEYSPDVVRYYLLREISFGQDGDFSEEGLRKRLNDELADVLGNFVHRVLTFIRDRYGGALPDGKPDMKIGGAVAEKISRIDRLMEDLRVSQALEEILALAGLGNEYLQANRPWEALKSDPGKAARCIITCANLAKALCVLLHPFMPSASEDFAGQLGIRIENLDQAKAFDLGPGHRIGEPKPVFTKVPEKKNPGERNNPGPDAVSPGDFEKLDIRVCEVVEAGRIEGSKKLLRLVLDTGSGRRTVVAGIGERYGPEDLVGMKVVAVVNMKPVKLMGVVSEGMILAADDGSELSVISPDRDLRPGSRVR
ncbi:MAG: methionine--tRNA ligase [Candidatus Hadarchaeales archaeon]